MADEFQPMSGDRAETPQTDAEFLRAVHAQPEDDALILTIRRVFAAWCGVKPTDIRADAATRLLHDRMKCGWARGWDETDFLIRLEEELHAVIDMNVQLPPFMERRFFFWSWRGPENLAEWIRETVNVVRDRINASGNGV